MKFMKWIWLVLFFCSYSNAFSQEVVRITNGEWPPYLSEHLKHYGVGTRIVTEAFALEKIKAEYGFFPWSRSVKLARMGKWDGAALWSYTRERAEDFYYTEPVIATKWVFFHLKTTSFDWKTVDDLKNLRIGGTLEYEYGKDFESAEKAGKINVYRVPKDEQNFEKLLKGRIDIFAVDSEVGYEMINSIFTKEKSRLLTHHPKPVKTTPLHLLLSRKLGKNKKLITVFDRGLKKLKQSGKTEQYLMESRKGEYKK